MGQKKLFCGKLILGWFRSAMSNRNYLLSQKLCQYLNQVRTWNDLHSSEQTQYSLS